MSRLWQGNGQSHDAAKKMRLAIILMKSLSGRSTLPSTILHLINLTTSHRRLSEVQPPSNQLGPSSAYCLDGWRPIRGLVEVHPHSIPGGKLWLSNRRRM